MKAILLKTEYLTAPIGIDVRRPLLMWNCEGGVRQTAYRVVTENWDSGKVASSSMRVHYPLPLSDRETVHWKVCLWDENDAPGEWSESSFETGISAWDADWITGSYRARKHRRYPADYFRRRFTLKDAAKGRLYITACGVYEARINGRRVGSFHLAPGITDYNKRLQYQTYDVTDLLKPGDNELGVTLADGWYRGSVGAWGRICQYGRETKLLCQLEVTFPDGSVTKVLSGPDWDWSDDGPVRFADNKDGETVDARLAPGYGRKAKKTAHPVKPSASNNVPVTLHETFRGKRITTPSGRTVIDFGQNIAGILRFSVTAKGSETIRIRLGEMLDENGEFTQKNIQLSTKRKTTPLQQIVYTCKPGRNEYETAFAIFGFQFALIESDIELGENDITAVAVYSDLELTSSFDCSDELMNRLYHCTLWSAKNNHADLPTDCPTRERHGWSGDAQIFCPTASYLFSYRSFAMKYLNDLVDGQRRNGCIRQIAPGGGVDFYMAPMDGSAGWSDAIVLIPWTLYRMYGDREILEKFYPAMRRYAEYKKRTIGKRYLTSLPTGLKRKDAKNIVNYGQSYGEWAEPAGLHPFSVSDFIFPHPEETTAYTVYLMEHMSRIAGLLGKTDDQRTYADCADRVRRGYQKLVEQPGFSMDTDRQCKQVRPLYMKLLTEDRTRYAKKRLLEALDRSNWRLGTGFLSTPFILFVLTGIDPAYAYRLLENREIPGWLAMPAHGANTIWEAWEGPASTQGGIGSLDHYSKGAVMEWVFSVMCGVNTDGENHFRISPVPGGSFTRAELTYRSVYGPVHSGWKKEDGGYTYSISVPPNCSADVTVGGKTQILTAGSYTLTGNGEILHEER